MADIDAILAAVAADELQAAQRQASASSVILRQSSPATGGFPPEPIDSSDAPRQVALLDEIGGGSGISDAAWYRLLAGSGISDTQGLADFIDSSVLFGARMHVPLLSNVVTTFTNKDSSEAFIAHSCHRRVDLTSYNQVRLHATQNAAASGSTVLHLKYATTAPTTLGSYAVLGASSTDVTVSASTSGGVNLVTSSWFDLTASAKTDVYITPTISGGDSVADPAFACFSAEFRFHVTPP